MILKTSSHYKSRSVLFLIVVALLVAPIGAMRTSFAAGEDWRPIEQAELALKAPVVEPNADAEAIFWDIRVDDGGQNDLVLSHYIRIKIFNERGRDKYSKIDIPYFNGVKIKDVTATGLPAGVKLSAKGDKITGKPTLPGVYTVTLQAVTADKTPQTTQFIFVWTVL